MPHVEVDRDERPDAEAGPQISVIVRSTDRPSLQATLDSIAVQQISQAEVVVVNALGPAHRPLPQQCGPFALRVTAAPAEPLPRAAAANAGLAAARAPMLIFLDDDDVFLPGHLPKLRATLLAHPDAVAAHTDVELGHIGTQGWQGTHTFEGAFDPVRLRWENFLPIHSVLIHRAHSTATANSRFDESFELFEDWDFWLQLCRLGRFVHVPGVSARYVSAGEGTSGVFADSAAATAARARLFDKWRQQSSTAEHEALLLRAQADHRASSQASAEWARSRAEARHLRTLIDAREADLAAQRAHSAGLEAVLAARDEEIASQQALIAARELELDNLGLHAQGLQQILSARDEEIEQARRHTTGLSTMLQARDDEIAALKAELARLRAESPLQALNRTLRKK